ncbi:MAG: hypothetical protein R3B70_24505 [Polyangiaceae bacterium]
MPVPIHDDDDDLDTTPSGIARRLTRVAEIIARANDRLDKIRAGFADPPDPEKPAVIAATSTIVSQATRAATSANELLGRLR